MAFTAYCRLVTCGLSQLSPPQFDSSVAYNIVNTSNNSIVNTVQSGGPTGQVDALLSPPISNQAAVLNALQSAVQAAETATPGLSFIWLEV